MILFGRNQKNSQNTTQSESNQTKIKQLINQCTESLSFFQKWEKSRMKQKVDIEDQKTAVKIQNLKIEMRRFLQELNQKKDKNFDTPSTVIRVTQPFEEKTLNPNIESQTSFPSIENTALFFDSDNLRISKKVKRYLQNEKKKNDCQYMEIEDRKGTQEQISEFLKIQNRPIVDEYREIFEKINLKYEKQYLEKVILHSERNIQKKGTMKSFNFIDRNTITNDKGKSSTVQATKENKDLNLKSFDDFFKRNPSQIRRSLVDLNKKLDKKMKSKENKSWMTEQRLRAIEECFILKNLKELEDKYSEKVLLKQIKILQRQYEIPDEEDEEMPKQFVKTNQKLFNQYQMAKMNPAYLLKENKKLVKMAKSQQIAKLHL